MSEKQEVQPENELPDIESPDMEAAVTGEDEKKPAEKNLKAEPKKKKEKKKTEHERKMEVLGEKLATAQDQQLRLRAEYDNYRKRTQSEKAAVYNNAVSDVITAMLPVADNMERAMNQSGGSEEDIKKGLRMIMNQLESAFEKLNVTEIGEIGEHFDPNLHNAVSHIEDESADEGVITQVMQKGYRIGDKVIRYAMVQVAN